MRSTLYGIIPFLCVNQGRSHCKATSPILRVSAVTSAATIHLLASEVGELTRWRATIVLPFTQVELEALFTESINYSMGFPLLLSLSAMLTW